jgi:hypothetical protein
MYQKEISQNNEYGITASISVSRHSRLADEYRFYDLVKGSSKTEYSPYTISVAKQVLFCTRN